MTKLSSTQVECSQAKGSSAAFSLVELLVVMAIMITIMGIAAPAFSGISRAGNVSSAAYEVASIIEDARSYAMARNTYVWVGLLEENVTATTPGSAGKGRIVIGVVASKDGTMIYDLASPGQLPADRVAPLSRAVKIDNMQLKTFPEGTGGGADFDSRPPANDGGTWIESGGVSQTPFSMGGYVFQKAIEFNPRGEARINNAGSALRPVVEIGLQPARGADVDSHESNLAAVQVSGVAGNVKIYRR
ncbi:MAG: hypothetical protein BGO12_14835 [Verrucomicrobia bacterium 61-8]|nr:MAG: hypothetical protein BGO12_14835 [Verrucomicrobia bacterium 61-8]